MFSDFLALSRNHFKTKGHIPTCDCKLTLAHSNVRLEMEKKIAVFVLFTFHMIMQKSVKESWGALSFDKRKEYSRQISTTGRV